MRATGAARIDRSTLAPERAERSCALQNCGGTTLRQLGRHDGEQPAAVRSDPCGGQRSDRKSVPPRSATLRSIALAHVANEQSTRPGPASPLTRPGSRAVGSSPGAGRILLPGREPLLVHRRCIDGFARDFLRLLQPDAGPQLPCSGLRPRYRPSDSLRHLRLPQVQWSV